MLLKILGGSALAEMPDIIGEGQHEITLQHIRLKVFDIQFRHIAPYIIVLL